MLKQYLCPPGDGVFAVSSGKDKKEALQLKLYSTLDSASIKKSFYASLDMLPSQEKVAILGVPSDCGGGILRGANWGPLFIRQRLYQTLNPEHVFELGDIRVIPHLLHDKYVNQETIARCQNALYGNEGDFAVSPLSITEKVVTELYQKEPSLLLFSLGGDHSVSYPLVKSYLEHKNKQNKKVGLIHFDAHTDLLKERLGIDICFGSWVTHILPFIEPNLVSQLGIRATLKDKSYWQETFGVKQYWADEINDKGMKTAVVQIIQDYQAKGVEEIYISFDIDALDESEAKATGTPEPNGLSLADTLYAIDEFCQAFPLTGADLVEVAPMIAHPGAMNEPENTLKAACDISSLLIESMCQH